MGALRKLSFAVGAKAEDRNHYVVYDGKTGAPYYDADGSGKGASVELATLTAKPPITAADFLVIRGGTDKNGKGRHLQAPVLHAAMP